MNRNHRPLKLSAAFAAPWADWGAPWPSMFPRKRLRLNRSRTGRADPKAEDEGLADSVVIATRRAGRLPQGCNRQFIGDTKGDISSARLRFGQPRSGLFQKYESCSVCLSGNLYHAGRIYYDLSERTSRDPTTVLTATLSWDVPEQQLTFGSQGNNSLSDQQVGSINVGTNADRLHYEKPSACAASIEKIFASGSAHAETLTALAPVPLR